MEEDITQYVVLTLVKAGFGIPFCTYQMYMACSIFNTLETKVISNLFTLLKHLLHK